MSFTENKFEYSIVGLVIVLVAGLFHLFSGVHSRPQVDGDIVYEMPRPKSFQGSDFDLSNREIDRNYINPFVKKDENAMAKGHDKPADVKAKTPDVKKAAAAVAAAAAKKKAEVTARVVGADPKSAFGTDRPAGDSNNLNNNYNNANRNIATQEQNANNTAAPDSDTNKLGPDQWIALLMAEPTTANMNKLIEARNKNEVDATTYNTITAALLKKPNAETQAVGLYGARTFPTAESFVIVAQSESTLATEQKTAAETFLSSYGQGSRLTALMSVLQVSDQSVVEKAAQVFVTGYQQAKSGTTISADPRSGRGGTVTTTSLTAYQSFIPLFKKLAQSTDSTLASLANSALAQIQTA